MNTDPANDAKASFDDIYTQPTPHGYFGELVKLDYSICDEARPFVVAAAGLLRRWDARVRMLDIGCSYGINSAAVRHGLSFAELARYFAIHGPREPEAAVEATRAGLAAARLAVDMECIGLDVSTPAVRFAQRVGLLDRGIVADLEGDGAALAPDDAEWVRPVNLLLATGAIGYVTERTIDVLLRQLGDGARDAVFLFTVLRVFDPAPIASCLQRFGLVTREVDDVLLPQRRFFDQEEQRGIVDVLESAGLDASQERAGRHYARLFVAANPERLAELLPAFREIAASRITLGQITPGQITPGQITPGQITPGQITPGTDSNDPMGGMSDQADSAGSGQAVAGA